MSRTPDRSEDDIEIVDSGHLVATRNPNADAPAFWALVESDAREERITVELQLRDESGVLARYERTQTVGPSARERYRFSVAPPDLFDQYVFEVVRREAVAASK